MAISCSSICGIITASPRWFSTPNGLSSTRPPALGLEQRQGILWRRDSAQWLSGFADLRGLRSADEDLARAATDEAVAGEVLAAFHGLEEVGGAGVLEFRIRGDRRLEVGHEIRVDGDHIALRGEGRESVAGRVDVHRRNVG